MSEEASQQKHVCHCGRSFIRKEHLKRHQATHGARNYVCDRCQRSFTRGDLLRRHVNSHITADAPGGGRRARACDACHANKSKCTGGPQCALCAKRGERCTFSKRGTSRETSVASTSPTSFVESPADDAAHGVSVAGNSSVPSRTSTKIGKPEVVNFLQTLTFQPSTTNSDTPARVPLVKRGVPAYTTQDGLKVIHLAISESVSSLEPECDACSVFKAWIEGRCQCYFDRVHSRWPVIHAPTFNYERDDFRLVAMVVLFGSSLEIGAEYIRDAATTCYDLLTRHLLEQLTHLEASGKIVWPVELYQACVLQMIYALYCGEESILRSARILCALLVAHMREAGVFSSETAAYQEKTFRPGTFIPYVRTNRETWKRLVACLVKVDSCLSLSSGQSPNVHLEELDVELPSTFALWSAFGLDVFDERFKAEPVDRVKFRLSIFAGLRSSGPSLVLVEDIELGLCGLMPSIWSHRLLSRQGVAIEGSHRAIEENLRLFKMQLNIFMSSLRRMLIVDFDPHMQRLLRAYSGGNPGTPRESREDILDRIILLGQETMLLYHLLELHLNCSGIDMTGGDLPRTIGRGSSPTAMGSADWKNSVQGAKAVEHSLAIVDLVESIFKDPKQQVSDPITTMALAASRRAMHMWFSQAGTCGPGDSHAPLEFNPVAREAWVDMSVMDEGFGMELINNPPCQCGMDGRMLQLEEAMTYPG